MSAEPTAKRVRAPDERPEAPWGRFPLAELSVLAGIVCLAVGVLGGDPTLVALGLVFAGIAGLEIAIREHFAGYRSHTTLLAAAAAMLVATALFYAAGLVLALALGLGALVFALAFFLLRRAFRRASGGLSFRAGGLRG